MQLFRSFAAFTAPPDVRGELMLLADILEGRERYPANFVNGAIYLKLELVAKGKVGLVVMTFVHFLNDSACLESMDHLQGCTLWCALASVNMRRKKLRSPACCCLLHLLVYPCTEIVEAIVCQLLRNSRNVQGVLKIVV